MDATRAGIIAEGDDPELRRHREEMLARWPWLRAMQTVAYVAMLVAITWILLGALLG